MHRACKLCGHGIVERHVINNIAYFYCDQCRFLQNFYWEDHPVSAHEQIDVNEAARADRWPAGDTHEMHVKAWQMLELMYWPLAWHVRRLNVLLKKIPGYENAIHRTIKNRVHRLLDFGCGHGTGAMELKKRDGFDSIGLDPYSPTDNPMIIRQDLIGAHFPEASFDGIFSIETLEHITNPLEIFTELRRVLKPGGVLLIQTSRLEDPRYQHEGAKWFYLKDPKTHVSIYSEPALRLIAHKIGWRRVDFKGAKFARFSK